MEAQPPKTILVVEDNPTCRSAVAYVLKRYGYRVLTATDGTEAAQLIHADLPDLMILDLGLVSEDPFSGPNLDGYGLMAYLRHRHERPVPVVVLSAADPNTARTKALASGAIAFFSKPPTREFFDAIGRILESQPAP
jgi:CheY-like chemotaxis protein